MKYVLLVNLIFLSYAFAQTVRVELQDGSVYENCYSEPGLSVAESSSSYFCTRGDEFLIVTPLGADNFMADAGHRNGTIGQSRGIESITTEDDGVVFFTSDPRLPRYNDSAETPRVLGQELAELRNFLQKHSSSIATTPSEDLTDPTRAYLQGVRANYETRKSQLEDLIDSPQYNLQLDDGSQFTCQRGQTITPPAAEQSQSTEQGGFSLYQTMQRTSCGAYDCGVDAAGNRIMLLQRSSLPGTVNSILTLNESGIINSKKIEQVSIPGVRTPLINNERRNAQFSAYGAFPTNTMGMGPTGMSAADEPEYTHEDFLPASLAEQSDYFNASIYPGYDQVLDDTFSLCSDDLKNLVDRSRDSFRDRLAETELAQYITVTNDVLQGVYLPIENLPENRCVHNGVYYNANFFQTSQQIQPSPDPRIISAERAQELFDLAKEMDDIAWNYAWDGCYARAHLMARRFEALGIHVDKVWLKGDLHPQTELEINWNFHVAPVVYVADAQGRPTPMVIDPSIEAGPVSALEWSQKMTPEGMNLTQTSYPFPANARVYNNNAMTFSNSDPYLPNDSLELTEEQKMDRANETMTRYRSLQ